jgi:copper transport protein
LHFSPPFVLSITTAIVSVFFILCISFAVESSAHPFYVDSTPKPFQNIPKSPGEVSVFFSEPIELSYSDISVLGPDGEAVNSKDPHNVNGQTSSIAASLKENLPPGTYTVNTKVLSAVDGHVVDNSFTFGMGTEITASIDGDSDGQFTGTTAGHQTQKDILSLEESLSRFPGYIGQVLAFGVSIAMMWLWKPFNQVPWLSEPLVPFRRLTSNSATKILIMGSSLILVSGVAMIVVQSYSVDATLLEIISTKFGKVWTIRMIQASALVLVAVGIYRKNTRQGDLIKTTEIVAILALALSLLVTYSLIAHAAAINQPLAILADFCHSAVASVWIGGVIFLAFACVPKLASFQSNDNIKAIFLSILIPRFSTIVVVGLGVILITGPLLLWTLENDLEITLASLYGKILLGKLSVGLAMIAMGGYHQFLTQKKFTGLVISSTTVASAHHRSDDLDRSSVTKPNAHFLKNITRLDKSLKVEAALGVGLLFMVSLMANMALPSGEFPAYERVDTGDGTEEFSASATANLLDNGSPLRENHSSELAYLSNGDKIQLRIEPLTIGQNSFEVTFFDSNNSIAQFINSSTIKLTQVEEGIGPIVVDMSNQSLGVFRAEAAFSLAGRWAVQVLGESVRPGLPNMVAIFDLQVKPRISDLQFSVEEYKIPQPSLPLYPIYDSIKRTIWVGDSMPGSGRIWEFNIESKNYTIHPISNTSLLTITALGNDGKIWYLDPTKSIIGSYDPLTKGNEQYIIPVEGAMSGMAIDQQQDIWLTVGGQSNKIVRLSPTSNNFTVYDIPTPNSLPRAIAVDSQGNVWFAESIGKLGRLDPSSGNITEYQPLNGSLEEPTAILPDPKRSYVYISEHEGKALSVLDHVFGTFSKYPISSREGLPFGMALDTYGNVWFAQHVIDKIGILNSENGEIAEVQIPARGSFVQWLVPDDQGRIWFAEQRGSSLGAIGMTLGLNMPTADPNEMNQRNEDIGSTETEVRGEDKGASSNIESSSIPRLNFGFADILGPLVAVGIVISAVLYSKNVLDVNRNIVIANQLIDR